MSDLSTRKIAADFKLVIEDVEELIKATASEAGERIGALRERLEKKIEKGKKLLAENAWLQSAEEKKAQAQSRLRENPWTGVAIAAGVGALLGWLIRRK
ncbi:MAG TPA: DUF883 family protein [Candidatus Binatia bacterium]|nr:DUF883 family protein [Candidatus Binatia bacterium]